MKKLFSRLTRKALRGLKLDLVHHDDDPAVRFASQARESIRLNPTARLQEASRLGWRLHVQQVLAARQIDHVIDVGANTGQFYREIRNLGHTGPVRSFEPLPALATQLVTQAAAERNWVIEGCALGEKAGTANLHVLADDALSSLRTPTSDAAEAWSAVKCEVRQTIVVPVHRLDQRVAADPALREAKRIYLKIDTQGSELEVLRGAEGVLAQVELIQFEASVRPLYAEAPGYTVLIGWLEARGYRLSSLFPICHHDFELVEFDCLMVKHRG